MSNTLVDQLEAGIAAMMADADASVPSDPEVAELLDVAVLLRALPDPQFKNLLKAELIEAAEHEVPGSADRRAAFLASDDPEENGEAHVHGWSAARTAESNMVASAIERVPFDLLPTLSGAGQYPVRRSSFMASLLAHAVAAALIVTSGIWAAGVHPRPTVHTRLVTEISYVLPPAVKGSHGGGGGGDHDILRASKGNPPRFTRDQIAPPAIVVRSEQPRLPVESTVVGPPNLSFSQTSRLGDPLSRVLGPAANGRGGEGGIGSGDRGGVGSGKGPGVGTGWGGGVGGGPYVAGGGVTAPHTIYSPEPDYSEEARKAKYHGIVILQVVVGADGRPQDIRIARSAGMGLDEKAIEAVRRWRFDPGTKDGRPVAVFVNVQVDFRLY